jgi:8-oxo-dGTP diphosphatase
MEELGIEIAIKQKAAEIQFGSKSRHIYYLVEQTGGQFGSGIGEEYTDSDPNSPEEGIYIPIWMPVDQLHLHENIYPAEVAKLVLRSLEEGWAENTATLFEELK